MRRNDGSHDFEHVNRVRKLALRIANEECKRTGSDSVDFATVELAALLHEIDDWKYATKEGEDASAVAASGPVRARAFLLAEGVKEDDVNKICMVVKMSSFHDELRQLEEAEAKNKENGRSGENAGEGAASAAAALPVELLCVQDADRIDAIGAMGIARCLMYGGKKRRTIYSEASLRTFEENSARRATHEEYARGNDDTSCLAHFAEKLVWLKDMMKTESGKKIAAQRHEYMLGFVRQLIEEARV